VQYPITSHLATPIASPKVMPTSCTLCTKHAYRVSDFQEQMFSLFFLDSSIRTLNRFVDQRMSNYVWGVSQKWWNTSPKIQAQKVCFSTRVAVMQILQLTVQSSRCCGEFVSVVLSYMSALYTNQQHPPMMTEASSQNIGKSFVTLKLVSENSLSV